MRAIQCQFCGFDFYSSAQCCPHCGRPSLFPNVTAASDPKECDALLRRYSDVKTFAEQRGAGAALNDFESEIKKSVAVISRSVEELQRLASEDNQLYATYYQLTEGGIRIPKGNRWDMLRNPTDAILFPGYREGVRFGALSLNDLGLESYGECHLILRDDLIAYRASVFEENSVIWMERHNVQVAEADRLPLGYRAVWDDRSKLCVAKLGDRIQSGATASDFAKLLIRNGSSSADDDFVEVHMYGPITIRSFRKVAVRSPLDRRKRAILRAIEEKLGEVGVQLEIV